MTLRTFAGLLLLALALACFRLEVPTETSTLPELDSLALYPDSISLQVGDTVQLTAVGYLGDSVAVCSGACDTVPGASGAVQVDMKRLVRVDAR